MNEKTQKLIIVVCRVFGVVSALVAMFSIVMVFVQLGDRSVFNLAIWIGILITSCFLWLFLSRINKESIGDVLKFSYIAKTMTEVIRGLVGGTASYGQRCKCHLNQGIYFP